MSPPPTRTIIQAIDRLFNDASLHDCWIPDETVVRALKKDTSFIGGDQLTIAAFSTKSHDYYWSFHGLFKTNKRSSLKKHKSQTNAEIVDVVFYFCHLDTTTTNANDDDDASTSSNDATSDDDSQSPAFLQ